MVNLVLVPLFKTEQAVDNHTCKRGFDGVCLNILTCCTCIISYFAFEIIAVCINNNAISFIWDHHYMMTGTIILLTIKALSENLEFRTPSTASIYSIFYLYASNIRFIYFLNIWFVNSSFCILYVFDHVDKESKFHRFISLIHTRRLIGLDTSMMWLRPYVLMNKAPSYFSYLFHWSTCFTWVLFV